MVEHPVDRQAEAANFGVGVGIWLGHPDGQHDLAAVQGQVRDLACGLDHLVQRVECPADDQKSQRRGDDQRRPGDHCEDQRDPQQRRVDVAHAQADHQRVAGQPAARGDQAIATQPAQIARDGVPLDDGFGELLHRGRRQRGSDAPCCEHSGIGGHPVDHHPGDEADRLARRVEELRTWTRPGERRAVLTPGRRRRHRQRFAEHHRRPVSGLPQLSVDLAGQVLVERSQGDRADAHADGRQQQHLSDEQPSAQRPGASTQV